MQIFLFFALFISVLAVIFAIQNNMPTTIHFFRGDYTGSLALVLLVALACGALISFLVSLPANISARWAIRQQRKKIGELEKALAQAEEKIQTAERKAEQLLGLPTTGIPPEPAPATVDVSSLEQVSTQETDQASDTNEAPSENQGSAMDEFNP